MWVEAWKVLIADDYSDPFDAKSELSRMGKGENTGYMEPYEAQRIMAAFLKRDTGNDMETVLWKFSGLRSNNRLAVTGNQPQMRINPLSMHFMWYCELLTSTMIVLFPDNCGKVQEFQQQEGMKSHQKNMQLYDTPYEPEGSGVESDSESVVSRRLRESKLPQDDDRPADEYDQPWEWNKVTIPALAGTRLFVTKKCVRIGCKLVFHLVSLEFVFVLGVLKLCGICKCKVKMLTSLTLNAKALCQRRFNGGGKRQASPSPSNDQHRQLRAPGGGFKPIKHGSPEFCGILGERIDPTIQLEKQIWYHGAISRTDAENLLRLCKECSYLVRNSQTSKHDYSLSLKSNQGFMHMKLTKTKEKYILGQNSPPFDSVPEVIHYYTTKKLPIKGAEHLSLLYPVATVVYHMGQGNNIESHYTDETNFSSEQSCGTGRSCHLFFDGGVSTQAACTCPLPVPGILGSLGLPLRKEAQAGTVISSNPIALLELQRQLKRKQLKKSDTIGLDSIVENLSMEQENAEGLLPLKDKHSRNLSLREEKLLQCTFDGKGLQQHQQKQNRDNEGFTRELPRASCSCMCTPESSNLNKSADTLERSQRITVVPLRTASTPL
ncbi:hypothetical protein IHE44_0011267 [Lamprotornis superbus]|uniref:SH2 domain-containing protein n=1 Tax=Lamprotornis superbus TaxID=245042 RepID=A0A835NPN7_9PASS|nr:hypothetical protein IHE44_0011267 [Lamprotornis superbus]